MRPSVMPIIGLLRSYFFSLSLLIKLLSTGKSSLTVQFVDGVFVESYYPTIENTFSRIIKYKGQDFATEIVDTAGQVSGFLDTNDTVCYANLDGCVG